MITVADHELYTDCLRLYGHKWLFWPLLTIEDSRDSCEHKKGDRIDLMSRSAKTAFRQGISQHWGQIIQQRNRLKIKTYN